ncbi:MAG: hypothetical protein EHM38_06705 [Geobacteraceae bacterium]|nr:MAG: hypothetical protein EHM38_06705 [Geobacteraceae bacterium]
MSKTPRMDSAFKQLTSTTPRMNWQLDQCYREGCKLERELAEALSDLEFRRDLFKLQEQQLNDVRAERDRLAEALREIAEGSPWGRRNAIWIAEQALAAVKGGCDE